MAIQMYYLLCIIELISLLIDQTKCNSSNVTEYDKRCPYKSEWKIQATTTCGKPYKYFCLWDDFQEEYLEFCREKPDLWPIGKKCVIRGNIDSENCFSERFQPFVFSTEGNSECIYTKSLCEDKGLAIHNNGSTEDNRKCRCDFDHGYSFVLTPQHDSFCNPFLEDCSCFRNTSEESFINFKELNSTKVTLGCLKTKRLPLSVKTNFQIQTTYIIERDVLSNLFRILACTFLLVSIIMTTGFVVLIILDTSEKRNTSEKKIHVISKNVGSCLTLLKETCSNEDPEGDDAAEIKNVRPFLEDETRIVLIGKIGAGKISTANSLLGCHFFHESDVPTLVTSKCEMVKGTVRRKPFLLIDTPGILGVNQNERETEMEIKKCIILAAPGPHAILFIIEYGRIRKDDIESIKTFLKYFGQNLKHFTIIVFTHAEKVKEYQTTDQWLRELPDLENFVNECERRYCLINNKANARDKEQYAMCIMNAIEALKFKNYKLYYTDDATM